MHVITIIYNLINLSLFGQLIIYLRLNEPVSTFPSLLIVAMIVKFVGAVQRDPMGSRIQRSKEVWTIKCLLTFLGDFDQNLEVAFLCKRTVHTSCRQPLPIGWTPQRVRARTAQTICSLNTVREADFFFRANWHLIGLISSTFHKQFAGKWCSYLPWIS